jgi:hypothetical protein
LKGKRGVPLKELSHEMMLISLMGVSLEELEVMQDVAQRLEGNMG